MGKSHADSIFKRGYLNVLIHRQTKECTHYLIPSLRDKVQQCNTKSDVASNGHSGDSSRSDPLVIDKCAVGAVKISYQELPILLLQPRVDARN